MLLNPPLRGSQTTLVPAGGGTVVELVGQVPSSLVLVDHALARAFDKGAIGQVIVEGDPNPEIFEAFAPEGTPAPGVSPGPDRASRCTRTASRAYAEAMTPIEMRKPARRWASGISVPWPTGASSGNQRSHSS